MNLAERRILIFVVAYNAESTLAKVLNRIPPELRVPNVEVLVIDDSSPDTTFSRGVELEAEPHGFTLKVLRNPENQGYGGNQKLGYRYAIDRGFEVVALLHGDGQYAPEKLPELLEPLLAGKADAVFGSRMLRKREALHGGMPLYKWIGNQVLTLFQNRMLGTRFSEFHSGYRLYSVDALSQIPFERNSNDFHFDTDIIVQFVMAGLRIEELPIPTFYGDEICHVNGLRYAGQIVRTMLRAQLHAKNLLYDRKFDVGQPELTYDLKLGFRSSHTMALESVRAGAAVLDIGCGQGFVAELLADKAACVLGLDQHVAAPQKPNVSYKVWNANSPQFPVDVSGFDQIFMLDIIEHLADPEDFMERIRQESARKRPEIILTTANVSFFVTRLMLVLGEFNYGRKGILDRTHTRLFTFRSLRELMEQTGFDVIKTAGIPAPFPKAISWKPLAQLLVKLNQWAILLMPGLFSYQIYVKAKARPTVRALLEETEASSLAIKSGSYASTDS